MYPIEETQWASPVAQELKNPPEVRETWIQSLGQEELLEKNGSPLQDSCLENPVDRGAWRLQSMEQHRVGHGRARAPMLPRGGQGVADRARQLSCCSEVFLFKKF